MKRSDAEQLVTTLKMRFEKYAHRHSGTEWKSVQAKLLANEKKLAVLSAMEQTGGEPDVVEFGTKELIFCDCSPESPAGRRSLCYDRAALDARKANKPAGDVVQMAASLGVELLDEKQYRALQLLGEFDCKTSSWILTPPAIRSLGGALFCDRRYSQVFVYHNGAESYYAARGFRGCLRI